ncbi:MAG: Gfo/Idh/MocA family oxidoreductase [Gemmatimonadaceae bacterium]
MIGYGLAGGTFHAPLIACTPGLILSAVVTTDDDRRRCAATEHPQARVVASVDELLQQELDLVVVASPNGHHFEHGLAALRAGMAVVIDKPFSATAAEGRVLAREAREHGRPVIPFHNRRWDGDFLTVRRLIGDGELGDVTRFESRFERWRVNPKPRWMQPGAVQAAEGMIYDLHTHLIDQALVLFGPVTHVYAETDRRRPGVQVDDESTLSLTHASGVRSHLGATIAAAQTGPRYRVYGTRGAYVKFGVDPQEEMLKAGRRPGSDGWAADPREQWGSVGNGERTTPVPTERGAYETFYAGVLDTVRDGAPPPVDANDAIAGLELVEAAYRSAAERRVVALG